ncbi:MAG TPA: HU family DNA-binding protein [Phycisphaerae bacterium]|nr:HU family DNA-binding protein [Phycisphaerae bacterium]
MAKKNTGNKGKQMNMKFSPAPKVRTKGEIYKTLSEATGLSRPQIVSLFSGMSAMIEADISRKGPGIFTVPGLLKIKRISKPATKARRGINPFTKEEQMFKAKPARNVVKAQALKSLKEMANK